MVDNVLIAVHTLPMLMLTSLSGNEILLLKYMNWSIDFTVLPFNKAIVLSYLKYMNSVLSELMLRPIILTACFRLYSRDSV